MCSDDKDYQFAVSGVSLSTFEELQPIKKALRRRFEHHIWSKSGSHNMLCFNLKYVKPKTTYLRILIRVMAFQCKSFAIFLFYKYTISEKISHNASEYDKYVELNTKLYKVCHY